MARTKRMYSSTNNELMILYLKFVSCIVCDTKPYWTRTIDYLIKLFSQMFLLQLAIGIGKVKKYFRII